MQSDYDTVIAERAAFREDLIAALTQIGALTRLVERAFNEGVNSGMDEYRKSRGGAVWMESRAKAALDAITSPTNPGP